MKAALREALAGPLPGPLAHRAVVPPDLPGREPPPHLQVAGVDPYRAAGVLLALLSDPSSDRYTIPLVQRPAGLPHHPGQIALPGGEADECEEPVACALRETFEEIGLVPERVEVLGRLTPVEISVSRYRVEPVVGWVESPPSEWRLQASEVEALLFADPDRLLRDGPRGSVDRERGGTRWVAPAYEIEGGLVWGATAMILAEFLALWQRARDQGFTS